MPPDIEGDIPIGGCGTAAPTGLDGAVERPRRHRTDTPGLPRRAAMVSPRKLDAMPQPSERRTEDGGFDGTA